MVGFDARNRDTINGSFICRLCNLILREPCQLSCGHRQCKTCIENAEGPVIQCTECSEQTQKNEIMPDRGFKNDMKALLIICSFCLWNGLFKDYEEHLKSTHPNPMCEFCKERFNSTTRLEEHKQKECTKITVPCPLKEFGCSEPVCRAQLPEHYLTESHQKAIIKAIRLLEAKALNEPHERVLGMDIDNGQSASSTMMTTTSENISSQMQEIYETINILAGGIQTLNDDTQRLSSESIKLQSSIESLTQDIGSLKLNVQEQSSFLDGVKPNQEILQQDVASLKQKIDDLQYVSYDATLIWKIVSFNEKMTDAQSERQTSIYSPPFYSSPTGYKMRARLYLNGDGNARRTHMSLFFVLMRGPNDAILKFPFNYKVTFCLYDQTPQQRHIIDSFRPDIKSNSFQRPRSEMNIASGIPKFFPLAMIQQEGNPYVRDDTMFIKVMVDFGDMPKTLLPYALSLNPGLPMHIQQLLIKQESERKAQQQPQSQPTLISPTNRPVTLTLPPSDETQLPQTIFNIMTSPNTSNTNDRPRDVNNTSP
ncbi:unnamed protein product [Rotaria socialis]|uniref:Uncharacterized protein n=3 Tax=Rotaria socialis TaxID=392032 RepID=A0A818GYK2_9BILA|nr:unnamed protein product [Rotaria socialis]CAF4473937.1 unnamed protein product [Rotaria socialis]